MSTTDLEPDVEAAPAPHPLFELPAAVLVTLGILTVIAVVAALYLARAFLIPLLIGILASYALRPVVDGLATLRIPRALGAGLVIAVLAGGASWAIVSLGEDAAAVIAKLPEAARKVRLHVGESRKAGPTSMDRIQEAATEIQGAAADAAGEKKAAKAPAARGAVREAEQSVWMRDYLLAQSALLVSVVAQAPVVLLLAYFLLASGEHFRRKLVRLVGPSLTRKKDAVRILDDIDIQIQRYLLATVATNILVAAATWLAFAAMGVEQAGVWGIAAGVFHFIPYLGPVMFAVASGVAGFLQFGTALDAFMVGGVSLVIAATVGSLILTWLQSRLARVNAAVLFIALLFFGWLWGIWGLLLGAPVVAIAKAICERVETLAPVSELLGQ